MNVRRAAPADAPALATLRALWMTGDGAPPEFEERMADWLAHEGDRRTTWLAELDERPVGMASMAEYRRMPKPDVPDSRWGYVSNVFVRAELRGRGIGSALLAALVETADERSYERLVLRPDPSALDFFARAGFVDADAGAGDHRLVVRARRSK